jgi:hypothetical protein
VSINGYGVSFWRDENVLTQIEEMVVQPMYMFTTIDAV